MCATTIALQILSAVWVGTRLTCSDIRLTSSNAQNPLSSIREARKILVVLYRVPSEDLVAESCRCHRGVDYDLFRPAFPWPGMALKRSRGTKNRRPECFRNYPTVE